MAINRSRGESITRVAITPAALQPKPIAKPIQVECHPRQVSQVFQDGENREEDCHGGQHHTDDPGETAIDTVPYETGHPPGHPNLGEQICRPLFNCEEQVRKHLRGDIGADNCHPKDRGQHHQHDG
jgi:hypothetical protein